MAMPRPCLCRLAQVPPPPAGRPLLRSAAWWEGGEVRGAWRARESQPQRQVVLQTRTAQGHEGASGPAAGFSDSRGSRLPRVTMTRGSFEAWMKRLVCLWGVWCRLKEFAAIRSCPHQAPRETARMRRLETGMKLCTSQNGIAVVQDCGRPGLSDLGMVWGYIPTAGGSLPPTTLRYAVNPLNGFLVPRVVWPVDRRNGARGRVLPGLPGRPCPGMQPAGCAP